MPVAEVVAAVECDTSTISRLETGERSRCSPPLFAALLRVYDVADRNALTGCADVTHQNPRAPVGVGTVAVNGAAVHLLRKVFGQSRDALAARARTTEGYLRKIETGAVTHCSTGLLDRLAAALGLAGIRALLHCPYGGPNHPRTAHDIVDEIGELEAQVHQAQPAGADTAAVTA